MKLLVLFPLLEKPPSKRNRVLNAAILAKISVKFRALLMFPYNSLMHTLSLFLVKVCVFTSMQRRPQEAPRTQTLREEQHSNAQ